jgi:hypothetical protein
MKVLNLRISGVFCFIIVYEKESPQKHQRHVHRSESVSLQNHKSQCPLHGSIQKPDRRIADHGASTPNVSQENGFFPGSLYIFHEIFIETSPSIKANQIAKLIFEAQLRA